MLLNNGRSIYKSWPWTKLQRETTPSWMLCDFEHSRGWNLMGCLASWTWVAISQSKESTKQVIARTAGKSPMNAGPLQGYGARSFPSECVKSLTWSAHDSSNDGHLLHRSKKGISPSVKRPCIEISFHSCSSDPQKIAVNPMLSWASLHITGGVGKRVCLEDGSRDRLEGPSHSTEDVVVFLSLAALTFQLLGMIDTPTSYFLLLIPGLLLTVTEDFKLVVFFLE